MSAYSIRDLEQVSGIKAHTLRIWEQRYQIIRPKRTHSNIRTYDDQDLKLVLTISLLKEHGYKISEISKMSLDAMRQKVLFLSEKHAGFPEQMHGLTLAMIELDEDRFEAVLRGTLQRVDFENLMLNLIFPFIRRIGTLWMTGTIGPAQEHFIVNLVRQKLIAAIESQARPYFRTGPKFLLFLPENEWHEISLLFAHYLLRSRQHHVVYLGQSLPLEELATAYAVYKPDVLVTVITSLPVPEGVQHYLYQLAHHCPEPHILVAGAQVVNQEFTLPENVTIVRKMPDLEAWI